VRALGPERRRNALRFWIARSGFRVPDTRRLDEICGPLLEARLDANPRVVWADVIVRRERGRLSIARVGPGSNTRGEAGSSARAASGASTRGASGASPPGLTWSWAEEASCELAGVASGQLELRQDPRGPLDLDALPSELTVRTRVGGERLRPRRGGPTRALKSLLQEAHVPPGERSRLPLVCSGERVLAVADLWLDESIQAGPGARRRGRLRWRR